MTPSALKANLVATAAARYRAVGRFAYHFARGKLHRDPVFAALLAYGLVPQDARVLDLGCGQGLLAAWLLAAQTVQRAGQWCSQWPAPPRTISLHGIEMKASDVTRARSALAAEARIEHGDIRRSSFAEADAIVILDVLHYIDYVSQEEVLARVRVALARDGVLVLRIGDASGGLAFKISNWVDQAVLLVRGHGWVRLYCRPVPQWLQLLDRCGFRVDAMPMSEGTPFANVLLVGHVR